MSGLFSRRWIGGALLAALALAWIATLNISLLDKLQFNGIVPTQPVSSGHETVQTITAPTGNISRVDLLLEKPVVGTEGLLKLQLYEVRGVDEEGRLELGEALAETILDEETFDYTRVRRFRFEPVAVAPGETYALRLTSDDPADTAVRPRASPADLYRGGRLYIDGKPMDIDLYFAVFHETDTSGMVDSMERFRPFPLDSGVFYILLFIIGAAAFGWLLWDIAGAEGQ